MQQARAHGTRSALAATLRSRPIVLLVGARTVILGTDTGEWCTIGADAALGALPSTGPFAAATVDRAGVVTVACWEPSVKQLLGADGAEEWSEIMLGAPPLALVLTERGVVAGDTGGGLTIVPTSSRIPVQELTAGEPIVDVCSVGDALVVLGASGALDVTSWPYREGATLHSVDTAPIGRPYAVYPGMRTGTAIVVGRAGFAVLVAGHGAPSLTAVTDLSAPIRGIAEFRDRDRACVYTDAGDAWIVDASLARVARIQLPSASVVGAATSPDGTVLAWTSAGDLHVVTHDGTVRCVAERDVVLAAADTDGFIAVHWTPSRGASVTRGRPSWT